MKYNKSKAPRGGPRSICLSQTAPSDIQNCDGVPLNQLRRGIPESKRARDKILNCKKYCNIATLNTRTLRLRSKQEELAYKCKEHSISIIGIVDHKIVHLDQTEQIIYKNIEDRVLITSSAWRLNNNAASGGVDFMISKEAAGNLTGVRKWNERKIVTNFSGNPALTVIVNYSPVEGNTNAAWRSAHVSIK